MIDCSKVTKVIDCECTIPNGGWCEYHQIHKPKHFVMLCQTKPAYRMAWNECRGPLQGGTEKTKASGPGTELKSILRRIGVLATVNCNCAQRAKQMDAWGPDGCRQNIDRIIHWLSDEARQRKLPFSKTAAKLLILLAIRRHEKKVRHHGHNRTT